MSDHTRYHHGDLRNALLSTAGEVLEQEGLDAVTFRGLARSLGVSHAAPGHHFGDRATLLAELAAEGFASFAAALEAAIDAASTAEELQVEAGMAYLRFSLKNPQRYRRMFGQQLLGEDCPEPLLTESQCAYRALLIISGKSPDQDPASYRMGTEELRTWALVHGAVTLWIDGALGPIGDEEEFVDLVRRTIAAQMKRE